MVSHALRRRSPTRTSPGPRIPSAVHRAGTELSRAWGWVTQGLVAQLLGVLWRLRLQGGKVLQGLQGTVWMLRKSGEEGHHGGRL